MQTNERWIFFKRPRSSPRSFFGRCPNTVKSLFPHAHRSHFALAFLSCRPMPLPMPSPKLLFPPSLPLTVGEFFSVHLFRWSRSSDCLGRYTRGLKDIASSLFFLFRVIYRFFYLRRYLFRFPEKYIHCRYVFIVSLGIIDRVYSYIRSNT